MSICNIADAIHCPTTTKSAFQSGKLTKHFLMSAAEGLFLVSNVCHTPSEPFFAQLVAPPDQREPQWQEIVACRATTAFATCSNRPTTTWSSAPASPTLCNANNHIPPSASLATNSLAATSNPFGLGLESFQWNAVLHDLGWGNL